MNLYPGIAAFEELGDILREGLEGGRGKYTGKLQDIINSQHIKNPWFTPGNVRKAVKAIADELTSANLIKWTGMYPALKEDRDPCNVGIIMAGNIPLVGFNDFITVLVSGNKLIAKTSSRDEDLIRLIAEILSGINPEFDKRISFTDGTLNGFDAVIATGSDNSARYFEYYFGKFPSIIRKNRNSIAIIDGSESVEEISGLGEDVFAYFGLGCRNVSKIFIPDGYDLSSLTSCWSSYEELRSHSKYANNYDFNKAVYLVNRQDFTDTGYLLLKEESSLASPVAVLFYEYYSSPEELKMRIESLKDKIQCVAGKDHIPFGHTRLPHLWDYADDTDTMEFLLKKKQPGIL